LVVRPIVIDIGFVGVEDRSIGMRLSPEFEHAVGQR